MDIIAAYREVGTYRGAAADLRHHAQDGEAGHRAGTRRAAVPPAARARGPQLRRGRGAGGRAGGRRRRRRSRRSGCCRPPGRPGTRGRRGTSAGWSRERKRLWRASITVVAGRRCGRRVSTWSSTGACEGGLHVFCAVLAWSRVRFVRFAADERADTTLAMLAECFEVLGGVPGVVLADRMGCLKGGVVANVVVPTADYVRFAAHYGFRPDFCEAADPEIEGDRGEPGRLRQVRPDGAGRRRSATWPRRTPRPRRGAPRSTRAVHSRDLRGPGRAAGRPSGNCWPPLPSLRASIGKRSVTRKVDRLSCVRFGSARYSVPDPADRRPGPAARRGRPRLLVIVTGRRRGRRRAHAGRAG